MVEAEAEHHMSRGSEIVQRAEGIYGSGQGLDREWKETQGLP